MLGKTCQLAVTLSLAFLSKPAFSEGVYLGLGSTSASGGRPLLGVDWGLSLPGGLTFSGMLAGGATDIYYFSSYTVKGLTYHNWGSGFGGQVKGGLGLGVHYTEKELVTALASENTTEEVEADTDFTAGPSFRVGVDWSYFYVAVSFTMGFGIASIGGGWGDQGVVAIGVNL